MSQIVEYDRVGRQIKNARECLSMTQEELADICGCSTNHVSHMETGKTKPSLSMLVKISNALHKDLNYFIIDTPFVHPQVIVNQEINDKLAKCNTQTIALINDLIDAVMAFYENQQKVMRQRFDVRDY